jgi:glycosyltransferase involved in cell wall biosynthesis
MIPISVIILTYNSAETIGATLSSIINISDDIHVVDSGSSDETLYIVQKAGASAVSHPFESYGVQRNWAIEHIRLKYDWQLHLDSDERLSIELITELKVLFSNNSPQNNIVGYYIPRLIHFHRQVIRHGAMWPIYHMRLFRKNYGRCEVRKYDQHFYVNGETGRLSSPMIDDIRLPLVEWTARHNRWADAEVEEILMPSEDVVGAGNCNPVALKRAQRARYYRAPIFWRALGLFIYRYFYKLGFLDGRWGLIFFLLQTFWFRFLVDSKLVERMEKDMSGAKRILVKK